MGNEKLLTWMTFCYLLYIGLIARSENILRKTLPKKQTTQKRIGRYVNSRG